MFSSTNLSRESISTRLEPYKKNKEVTIKPILKKQKTELEQTNSTPLNNVIVLADNKNYSRDFLKCLGMTTGSPWLCTTHIPTKMFTFQIYGLEESDEKIFTHVKDNAGLIIIITYEEYTKLFDRINFYCEKISHIPILIVLENSPKADSDKIILGNKVNKSNVRYELMNDKFHQNHKASYIQGSFESANMFWFNSLVLAYKPLPKNMLDLEELVKQFVDCNLSIENWSHFNRLRLVYFSLTNFGYDKTINQSGWLCVCWNKYKNTIGHSHLWNYTLTKFWIDKIYSLMLDNPQLNFAQLYNNYTFLSDGNLHKKYYTNEVLFTEKARNEWVKPNLLSN